MTIEKIYYSNIDKAKLFEAWISPEMTIEPILKIECNPVVGGNLKLYSGSDLSSANMIGVFKEIIWNEKLQYTWHWVGSDETTLITVEFKQDSEKTLIELQHSGFLTEESLKTHDSGWDHYFAGIEKKISS